MWEKPSRYFQYADITKINYEPMLNSVISDPDFPKNNIILSLPGDRKDPALKIYHQFTEKKLFNPFTHETIKNEKSLLALFLTGMHYGKPLKIYGLYIFGFMAVGAMFLTIGGLILLYVFNYKNSVKTLNNFFSKWHRKIFLWISPVFLMIVLCGSVMGVSFLGSSPLAYVATKGVNKDIRPIIGPVLFPEDKPVKKAGQQVEMMPINKLILKAREVNPDIVFKKLYLQNWNDVTARIKLEGYNPARPFLNGVTNKPTIVLSGHDGSLIKNIKVQDRPWAVMMTDFVYYLHLLFGVNIGFRIFIALLMVGACIATGFGIMLWLEKKSKKFKGKIPFYHWMSKLSQTAVIGVIPATGLLFCLQWILPFEMENRITWQQGLFFDLWLASLAWSFYRIDSYKSSKEIIALGGLLLTAAPIIHFIKTDISKIMENNHIWTIDLSLGVLGLILILISKKIPGYSDHAKKFWLGKLER